MNDYKRRRKATTESGLNSGCVELPHECLVNIISRITLAERWQGPIHVCKQWLNACRDPYLNTEFDLDAIFTSTDEKTHWCTPEFEHNMDNILRSFVVWSCGKNVSSPISVIRTRFCSDFSIKFVAKRCPNLQVLAIKSSENVTDLSMTNITYSCPKITELDVSLCHKISHESLALIGRNCQNLKVLKRNLNPFRNAGALMKYTNASPQVVDAEADAIGFMPKLEHLELSFSTLKARGLGSICDGCPNLIFIDFTGYQNLTIRDILTGILPLEKLEEVRFLGPASYIYRKVLPRERSSPWTHVLVGNV